MRTAGVFFASLNRRAFQSSEFLGVFYCEGRGKDKILKGDFCRRELVRRGGGGDGGEGDA